MRNNYRTFMLEVCEFRKAAIQGNRSKKDLNRMNQLLEKLHEKFLLVHTNLSTIAGAKYLIKHEADFRELMPGESCTHYKKYNDQFTTLLIEAKQLIDSNASFESSMMVQEAYNRFQLAVKNIIGPNVKVSATIFEAPEHLMKGKSVKKLIGNGSYVGSDSLTLFNKNVPNEFKN